MAIDEINVMVSVKASVPGFDQVQAVARSCEARGIKFEFSLLEDVRTIVVYQLPHQASLIQPFLDIVCLVPPRRSDWPLRTCLEQIRLISQLPVGEFAIVQSLTD
jgi:hypothetical protein